MTIRKPKKSVASRRLHPTRIIALAFAGIILIGAILLTLPIASRSGESSGFLPALFTATSATCVTGLVLFDTWSQWSGFGQVVILTMIELGGLGFMSAASLFVFILRRKIGLRQRMIMAQALSLDDMQGVVRLQKWVLIGSLCIQLVGAAVLFFRFLPERGAATAAAWGIFHSVSAFCNAGFDIFGSFAPGQSVVPFAGDPVVLITLMVLIVVGGLGFFVWEELIRLHKLRKLSVYTKLVLLTTAVLILVGGGLLLSLEWSNPATIGEMSTGDKVLNSLFQAVTLRTAGFASFDQAGLTEGSKVICILLMMIGGSSGSTAGGIKTVTFVVLLLFLATRLRGRSTVTVFKRSIQPGKVLDAMTIVTTVLGLAILGAVIICITSPQLHFVDALFETVSALATVGLTTGATVELTAIGQLVIICFMYFGRVGVLTLSLGFLIGDRADQRFQYAHTNLLIG